MPGTRICSFNGIEIRMFWLDHPPAHVHVRYAEHKARVTLEGQLLSGGLPPRVMRLLADWLALRRAQLEADWLLAINGEELQPVDPLED